MSESSIHIYCVSAQPATRYVLASSGEAEPIIIENPPGRRIRCMRCDKVRLACHLSVQSYYDATNYFCSDRVACTKRVAKPRRKAKKAKP